MTIEEKARAYDKFVEELKSKFKDFQVIIYDKNDLEKFFTELKESEDERIRKKLIESVKGDMVVGGTKDKQLAIAWLEKQGEKKTVEMKSAEESLGVDTETYNKIVDECIFGEQKPADKVESFNRYEGLTDFERTLADICIGWIGEELGWKEYIKDNADVLLRIAVKKFNSVQDATFEQKPCSEEDEKMVSRIRGIIERYAFSQSAVDVNGDLCEREFIEPDEWLKSIKYRVQSNQEWSKEDESILQGIWDEILANKHYAKEYEWKTYDKFLNWLNSLKDRVQPQPKQEWSEADENYHRICLDLCAGMPNGGVYAPYIKDEAINWLKSLRPQNTWKPSDEQMDELRKYSDNVVLRNLYYNLKKLKG